MISNSSLLWDLGENKHPTATLRGVQKTVRPDVVVGGNRDAAAQTLWFPGVVDQTPTRYPNHRHRWLRFRGLVHSKPRFLEEESENSRTNSETPITVYFHLDSFKIAHREKKMRTSKSIRLLLATHNYTNYLHLSPSKEPIQCNDNVKTLGDLTPNFHKFLQVSFLFPLFFVCFLLILR